MLLDDKLCWYKHYEAMVDRLVSMIGAVYRCRNLLNEDSEMKIYIIIFSAGTKLPD